MRQFFYPFIVLTLFVSCEHNPKNEKTNDSSDSTFSGVSKEEQEYLTKRDYYFNKLQNPKSTSRDSLINFEKQAISDLETRLKTILKPSYFSGKGEINNVGFIGFGMLAGLHFDKDSLDICYTSKNLFFKHIGVNENELNQLSPEVFEELFRNSFPFGGHVSNFSWINIHSSDSVRAYGMFAGLSNMTGRFTPQYIYVLVLKGDYVYIAAKELKEPVKEIPRCVAVWDSIIMIHPEPVDDNEFSIYCDCYKKNLKRDNQYPPIHRQMELIADYLEGR